MNSGTMFCGNLAKVSHTWSLKIIWKLLPCFLLTPIWKLRGCCPHHSRPSLLFILYCFSWNTLKWTCIFFFGIDQNNTKLKPSTKVIISILSSATFWCIGIHQIDDNIYSNVENRPNLRLIIHKHVDQIYSNLVWVSIRS